SVMGTETHYALLTGKGTLFPDAGPLGPSQVVDDPSKTLLIVEVNTPRSPTLQWTEPGDVDIANMSPIIGNDLGGNHVGGATVATVDGRGHFIHDGTDPTVVRALITPAGGEGLADDVFD